ncbi:MAG: hypothetical protein P4L40_08750 [Terracidiphilus sp.]|nr:hypothetical protein [Terracidiphilus sp.]
MPVISTLIRWEKGSSHLDPHIMLVPHGVTVNEDYTIEVPPAWELDPAWRHRNDMQDIREHNVGVQLSKSKLVKSAAGA